MFILEALWSYYGTIPVVGKRGINSFPNRVDSNIHSWKKHMFLVLPLYPDNERQLCCRERRLIIRLTLATSSAHDDLDT